MYKQRMKVEGEKRVEWSEVNDGSSPWGVTDNRLVTEDKVQVGVVHMEDEK